MATLFEAAADLGYEMDLSHLTELDISDLCEWRKCYKDQKNVLKSSEKMHDNVSKIYPLDVLYDLFPLPHRYKLLFDWFTLRGKHESKLSE